MTNLSESIVEVLRRRISDEDFDFAEAAQAITDSLCLREQWTYRHSNGSGIGYDYESREQLMSEIASLGVNDPIVIYRFASDWKVETSPE